LILTPLDYVIDGKKYIEVNKKKINVCCIVKLIENMTETPYKAWGQNHFIKLYIA